MSTTGRAYRFRVIAAIGDLDGCIGLGEANREQMRDAILSAIDACKRSLIMIKMGQTRSIPHPFTHKLHHTEIFAYPVGSGVGLNCPNIIRDLCTVAGIKDLKVRVVGSRNPMNTIKAFFEGLRTQMNVETSALIRGVHASELRTRIERGRIKL